MSLTDELADWLQDEVTWEQRTGVDAHGAPVYASAVSLKCRVVTKQRLVTDQTGAMRVSAVQVYLRDPQGIQARDRLTLPTGFSPAQPTILAVSRIADDTGTMVERIYT